MREKKEKTRPWTSSDERRPKRNDGQTQSVVLGWLLGKDKISTDIIGTAGKAVTPMAQQWKPVHGLHPPECDSTCGHAPRRSMPKHLRMKYDVCDKLSNIRGKNTDVQREQMCQNINSY